MAQKKPNSIGLEFSLFFQRGRELELTDLGLQFYKKLPQALSALESLVNLKITEKTACTKPIRFASFEVFTSYFLPRFIAQELKIFQINIYITLIVILGNIKT